MPTIDQARRLYDNSNQVHDFDHVLRVYRLAEQIAGQEGADLEIVRAAALLHDVDDSSSGGEEARLEHHEASAAYAGRILKEEGWPDERIQAVQSCIRTHRFRAGLAPETLEAKVLYDADKLDAIGAIGAARSLAFAVLDGQPLYAEPSETFRETLKIEAGEAYTAYHEFLFKLSKIKGKMHTEAGKALAEERHRFLAGFFEQLRAEVRGER
ncbi:MAG: HD domain-containing protein [Chloroflexota bacterium]